MPWQTDFQLVTAASTPRVIARLKFFRNKL
jgi:hypothetical protein